METELVESGRFERTLTVKMLEADLEDAKNQAAKKLSGQMRLKGFRPGKAPRRIVEATVGADTVRAEAIDSGMSAWVGAALEGIDLELAAQPTITDVRDTEDGFEMDVKLALWPELDSAPVIEGRQIVVESNLVSDEEIDEQIDRLREQFAELVDVERSIRDGDIALIDLNAEDDGQPVDEVSAKDLSYEVGGGGLLEGLDGVLRGEKAGSIVSLTSTLPESFGEFGGEELSFKILVKSIKEKRLPNLDDEWVGDISEFSSVDDLRTEIAEGMAVTKTEQAVREFRNKAIEAVIEDVDVEIPEGLIESETEAQIHSFAHQLETSGIGLEDYMRVTGQSQEAVVADARLQADRAVKTRLALDAIARDRGLEATEEDLEEAVSDVAEQEKMTPGEYLDAVRKADRLQLLTADILRQQALDLLIEEATPIDGDGNALDLTLPEVEEQVDEPSEQTVEVAEAVAPDDKAETGSDDSADDTSVGPDAAASAMQDAPANEPAAEEIADNESLDEEPEGEETEDNESEDNEGT
ncbi:MAG: trigger factor [Acidimicrobiia bacterium]|nr:trigger factor [Acidimicrobiia bacterium]